MVNKKIYRVLYDFQGQTQSEMTFLHKDELLEIIKQEGNGTLPALHHISLGRCANSFL